MEHWYVIRTKARKERDVVTQLTKAGYKLFFPQIKGLGISKPLFPCYLFIHTNFGDPNHHRLVRFTRGVNSILGNGQIPQTVPVSIIDTLRGVTRNGELLEQELLFKEGDLVKVKRGVLKDLQGIVEKNLPATGRVKILFKWLSGNMRATLKYTELTTK